MTWSIEVRDPEDDEARELHHARRVYLAAGYRDIAPYGDNGDATVWMGLRLDGSAW